MKKTSLTLLSIIAFTAFTGCFGGNDPVPKSQCSKVVSHAAKILGDKAPSRSNMMSQCKAATDAKRGCVMAANSAMKILNCDL